MRFFTRCSDSRTAIDEIYNFKKSYQDALWHSDNILTDNAFWGEKNFYIRDIFSNIDQCGPDHSTA